MRAFFIYARVQEARKRGWEISNFLGFLGIVGVDGVVSVRAGARANLSESEKFLDFWVFGVKMKFFEFFGKFEFFGFQKGRRYELILY